MQKDYDPSNELNYLHYSIDFCFKHSEEQLGFILWQYAYTLLSQPHNLYEMSHEEAVEGLNTIRDTLLLNDKNLLPADKYYSFSPCLLHLISHSKNGLSQIASRFAIETLHNIGLLNSMSLQTHGWKPGEWRGIQIPGAYIPYADFSGMDLSHTNLRATNLQYANLTDTILINSNLSGAVLKIDLDQRILKADEITCYTVSECNTLSAIGKDIRKEIVFKANMPWWQICGENRGRITLYKNDNSFSHLFNVEWIPSMLAISPNLHYLAGTYDDSHIPNDGSTPKSSFIYIWSIPSLEGVINFPIPDYQSIYEIVFSSCKDHIAISYGSGCRSTIITLNIATNERTQMQADPLKKADVIAYSPRGDLIAGGYWDGCIELWNAQTGDRIRVFSDITTDLSFSYLSPEIRPPMMSVCHGLYEVSDKIIKPAHLGSYLWITALAFSPNGKLIASACHDSTVRLWSVENGKLKNVLTGRRRVIVTLKFSSSGNELITEAKDGINEIWSVKSGLCRQILKGFHYSSKKHPHFTKSILHKQFTLTQLPHWKLLGFPYTFDTRSISISPLRAQGCNIDGAYGLPLSSCMFLKKYGALGVPHQLTISSRRYCFFNSNPSIPAQLMLMIFHMLTNHDQTRNFPLVSRLWRDFYWSIVGEKINGNNPNPAQHPK